MPRGVALGATLEASRPSVSHPSEREVLDIVSVIYVKVTLCVLDFVSDVLSRRLRGSVSKSFR